MLNEILKNAVSSGKSVMNIYRHFKGGYYIVHAVATDEPTGGQVVVYQSLQDGKMWIRPLSVFQELVPEGRENPTGQKYRFERVTKFNNQLNLIPTEQLVRELLSRDDCPVELQITDPKKLWRTEYIVGRYQDVFVDIENSYEDFAISNIFTTYDGAVSYVERFPNLKILKLVYLKQDFD